MAAIKILANLNIKEGLDFAIAIESNKLGKASFKFKATWAVLKKYGPNARAALKAYRVRHVNRTDRGRLPGRSTRWVRAVEGGAKAQSMITLEQAIPAGK